MNHMHPSVWTGYYKDLLPEESILCLKKSGFSCAELSFDHGQLLLEREKNYEKTGCDFRAFLEDNGFSIPQGQLGILSVDPELQEKMKRKIALFQTVGIKNAVICFPDENGEEDTSFETYRKTLKELQSFVRGTDFTLCIGNRNSVHYACDGAGIVKIIEGLGGENLGVCLDTGHLNLSRAEERTTETQGEFIRKTGSFLKALHINGNNGVADQRIAPFAVRARVQVDYREVLQSLTEICYSGLFNLKVEGEVIGNVPRSVLDLKLSYLKDLLDFMLTADFFENSSVTE